MEPTRAAVMPSALRDTSPALPSTYFLTLARVAARMTALWSCQLQVSNSTTEAGAGAESLPAMQAPAEAATPQAAMLHNFGSMSWQGARMDMVSNMLAYCRPPSKGITTTSIKALLVSVMFMSLMLLFFSPQQLLCKLPHVHSAPCATGVWSHT